jgi:hypothetical protein
LSLLKAGMVEIDMMFGVSGAARKFAAQISCTVSLLNRGCRNEEVLS